MPRSRPFPIPQEPDRPDPQQQRVYDMEGHAFRAWQVHATSVHQLRRMSTAVCNHYDLEPVTLGMLSPRGEDLGVYDDDLLTITFCPLRGRTAFLLAHELAHHYCYQKHPRAADHGPTWAKHYAEILEFLGVMPAESFRAAARKHRIAVAR